MPAISTKSNVVRIRVRISGTVQGVGFRPFVYRLAKRLGLTGTVCNDSCGVTIEVQGLSSLTNLFVEQLKSDLPPLAIINSIEVKQVQLKEKENSFQILSSKTGEDEKAIIPPDVATCNNCLAELLDPNDRRYHYPFVNCTDCGPRYTIVLSVPYDRCCTSMNEFKMCSKCQAEYENVDARRFHAEPNACPICGPKVSLLDKAGNIIPVEDPVLETISLLKKGFIVAIKGLGGFHLACDAQNKEAVVSLRRRKGRPDKPFAVMARDLDAVKQFAYVNSREVDLLQGWQRPIVLLKAKENCSLAPEVSGNLDLVGTMLPYTPLHHLLLSGPFKALVMTSGNFTDEPIEYKNIGAINCLKDVVDFFLVHNREIVQRLDDSIVRAFGNHPVLYRRSRGFVPDPIILPKEGPSILAMGADLKNTCCATKGSMALVSQHIGDLEQPQAVAFLEETIAHLQSVWKICPELIVHDLHPDYTSTRIANKLEGIPKLAVQHHHAHSLSCLADNGFCEPALSICLDGTGYGTDGQIWGGEFLLVDGTNFKRLAHFKYLPMPGGDKAAQEPWRMAVSALVDAFDFENAFDVYEYLKIDGVDKQVLQGVAKLARTPNACIKTSSAGRLFDAVASILGVCQKMSFEGQAAMQLEQLAQNAETEDIYPYDLNCTPQKGEVIDMDFARLFQQMIHDLRGGVDKKNIALIFHNTVVACLVEVAKKMRNKTKIETIALSGGVFQNQLIFSKLFKALYDNGFKVLAPIRVPPNDGGISLGQAWAGILYYLSLSSPTM